MISRMRAFAALAALAGLALPAAHGEEQYQVVCNFTELLPSNPSVVITRGEPKVGLASAQIRYAWGAGAKQAVLGMPERGVMVPGPGTLKLWVKGDGSRNSMRLVLLQAREVVEPNGNRYLTDHREIGLAPVALDSTEWKEVSFDAMGLEAGKLIWWQRLEFSAGGETASGTVQLDDLRLVPKDAAPGGSVAVSLVGSEIRDLADPLALGLDVRNFSAKAGELHVRVAMVDRNQNQVLDRDFAVQVAANSVAETKLELDPQQIAAYLPPFHITGDVLGAGLPDLAQRIDRTVVVGNGLMLYTAMGDALGQWFTAGMSESRDRWHVWQMGAGQRASPVAQTTARIAREDIPPEQAAAAAAADPAAQPLGRYALGLSFDGEAAVYRGADRLIPGNAFALGMWVRGDGSGARLSAAVLDFSDLSDFWEGGWKRTFADLPLCTLDFTGWRYVEIALPGNGRGTNLARGSTQGIDFPLELSALRVIPAEGHPAGTVGIGAIYGRTQIASADTLSLQLGYDDPEQRFAPDRGAWLEIHNGARTLARKIAGRWELLDRAAHAVATGTFAADLAPGAAAWQRIDLGTAAAAAAGAAGPLTLSVTAADAADATVSAARAIALAKPDSVVLHEDFEADRGYLGLRADGVPWTPESGQPAASTTDAVAHDGKRSLRIPWEKSGHAATYVAIDPELSGIPTEISLWVHGDGSGALFHPVIGDRAGIPHGMGSRMFDLLLARTDGPLQNAVRVDWQGWKQLVFRLPPVPADWAKDSPVRPYVPSYPLGLHLAVDGRGAAAAGGEIAVDDIEVTTHLEPSARVSMSTMREGAANIVPPGTVVRVRLANADRGARRSVMLAGGAIDAAGRAVAAPPAGAIDLAPGEIRIVELAPALPAGAYALRLRLEQDGKAVSSSEGDLIVGDPVPLLGADWEARLADESRLRAPLADPMVVVDEDWDWVERFPGNIQLDTMRERAAKAKAAGMSPWMLLGYSAFWAAGIGLEQLDGNRFVRPPRDIGHGVDIFLVPQRAEHWRDYVAEVMRGVGTDVGGFMLWDNPDGSSSLAVPPERFAAFAAEADAWRRRYCPDTRMIIGGMAQATALPYLAVLAKLKATEHIGGIEVRFDAGRLSPEDVQVADVARQALATLDPDGTRKPLLRFADLDWAVEKGDGLDAFTQAAYLVRSDLTLRPLGISPALTVRNGDWARLGQGMAYRTAVYAPPLKEQRARFLLKPAWWAMARCRQLLAAAKPLAAADIADAIPGRTRCVVLRRDADGTGILAVWRNDDAGAVSLGGLTPRAAEDSFGSAVAAADGWLPVGKLPVFISFAVPAEQVAAAVPALRVRDGARQTWPQRPIAVIAPGSADLSQRGGEATTLSGRTVAGAEESWPGLRFAAAGGSEAFRIEVPAGCGVVLRHRYLLDKDGFTARVSIDGTEIGTWDLRHAEAQLGDGLRESCFAVPAAAIGGKPAVEIAVAYAGPATSGGWTAYAESDGAFPLSAFGPIHADQAVGRPRLARNLVGAQLMIASTRFADGVAVYADSLLEYPIARRFSRFRAKVGVDAATEGRGSVVFEVWADGKKRWNSPTMSGLDEPRDVDVDITGVERLRLVVRDGGDGNRFDAADWAAAELIR